jgi:alanine racemase
MPTESSLDAKPRAWVEVDLAALQRNARALERHARAPLIPMVKGDAYGLGAVPVVRALDALDPYAFGVSNMVEGEELRRAGITRPIIIFTPTLPHDLPRLKASGLTPSLAAADGIARWRELDGGAWHLAIETGMNRAGVGWTELAPLHELIAAFPPVGAFTHFHSAEKDDGSIARQEARFLEAIASLPVRPAMLHTENSGAAVRRHPSPWQAVRPGAFLYGIGSGPTAALQPEPVVHLRARVLEVRDVADGETVSYSATYRAQGTRRIATIAVGYADGYRRALSNVGRALVADGVAPIAGLVTMDMLMLDVTGLNCDPGDEVTLLGRAGDRLLTAETVAEWAYLSPYELLTGLRQRLVRIYTGGL